MIAAAGDGWWLVEAASRYRLPVTGMLLYWVADMFALRAATAAFSFRMTPLALIVALGTGFFVVLGRSPAAPASLPRVRALTPQHGR